MLEIIIITIIMIIISKTVIEVNIAIIERIGK